MVSGRELVEAVLSDFPDHAAGTRPVHTFGLGVRGHFVGSDVAPRWCVAEHFSGERIPVTVRFSNGNGSGERHDEHPDVRGMAARFHLPSGELTDLIAMTLPEFFVRTPEQFLDFTKAGIPKPDRPDPWWRRLLDVLRLRKPGMLDPAPGATLSGTRGLAEYADRHSFARAGVIGAGLVGVPVSWTRAKYHAVHTFVVTGDDGQRRHARFAWQPVAGVFPYDDPTAEHLATDFLSTEMRRRLTHENARFILKMTLADPGDDVSDPTETWPVTRRAVMMGTLVLTDVPDDQAAFCERLSFNPMRLVPGVEASDDPILHARLDAYETSAEWRGADRCPFHAGGGS